MLQSAAAAGVLRLGRCVRFSPGRPGVLALAGLLLMGIALIVGLLAPPAGRTAGSSAASAGGARLLVAEYGDAGSTLWLVDPADPAQRVALTPVAHAPGWAPEGAVAPAGDRVAMLVVPPGGSDPATEAQLILSDGGPSRTLAQAVDLRGGLAWSADGAHVYARRQEAGAGGRLRFTLLEWDVDTGRERALLRRDDILGLYPIGRPLGGAVYAVAIGPGGSQLLPLDGRDAVVPLSAGVTRDWRLSPDGETIAFTAQQGLRLDVRLLSLGAAPLRVAATAPSMGSGGGSASPAWHPDGSLSLATFGEDAAALRVAVAGGGIVARTPTVGDAPTGGVALPVAWAAGGDFLALRRFDGSGPGDPGREVAAVRDAAGVVRTIEGAHLRIFGWWGDKGRPADG